MIAYTDIEESVKADKSLLPEIDSVIETEDGKATVTNAKVIDKITLAPFLLNPDAEIDENIFIAHHPTSEDHMIMVEVTPH